MTDVVVVIPARWASSRFPGKVLAPLGGRPLVLRVCDLAAKARRVRDVIVATDDPRVLDAVRSAGYRAEETSPLHQSGTDRVAEVAARRGSPVPDRIVIGLQADEPFLDPGDVDALAGAFDDRDDVRLATLAVPLPGRAAWLDPNTVKAVVDGAGRALYFSRSPVPYGRPAGGSLSFPPAGEPPVPARQHVGVYAWRADALAAFASLPVSPLERAEGLEQLRALEAGWSIRVLPARGTPFGIDTPDDLVRAEQRLASESAHEPT